MNISRLWLGGRRIRRATALAGHGRPLSWLASACVAAGFAVGSSGFAQYPASGQTYSTPYTPGNQPAFNQSVAAEAANQTDEQLLTIGRLLEQQGRYAQAQRIYTELERRRFSGPQQPGSGQTPANIPYQQQVQYQPAGNYQPQYSNMPATGMPPQAVAAPIAWQNAPAQMPNQLPMMQFSQQGYPPVYDSSAPVTAMQVQPAAQLPPPAPPSESYVVDTEVTPQPKSTGLSGTQGWRSAIAPLPAAFKAWNSDRPTPYPDRAASSVSQPNPRNMVAEQTALPDFPIAPVAPLNSMSNQFPSLSPQVAANSPPRFASPTISNGERRPPLGPEQRTALPPTLRLAPLPKSLDNLEAEREISQKQSDAIRIIPGHPGPLQLKPEMGSKLIDPRDQPPELADGKPPLAGDLKPPAPNTVPEPGPPSRTERAVGDGNVRFDLAAWVSAPEFREIHTADVIAGLDLLARPEARYRAAGAMRIASAGESARTALPVLRKVLTSETDHTVRLRIAEALLKLQPNDRVATECLAELLTGRNESELRQGAASALGAAGAGRNPIAVASLTDALDDPSPQVRAAAATSLGLFGRSAANSISRLENSALNDIPTVRQAATLALASIRGMQNEQSAPAPRESASLFRPQTNGQLAAETLATGRAKLIDRLPPRSSADSVFAQQDTVNSQPKLFPSDRVNGQRVQAPAHVKSEDDAVPISATAPEAPTRPFVPVQRNLAPPDTQSAASGTSSPSDDTPPFVLQSEAGTSKAGSKP
jgi:HEAT repeat protein